ncbi:MAG TPA: pyridoxal 5'-phosphate synthase glutaminase subunit PdxT [Candidatus Thermoplasmatota archaeon]|nr:pyridoxal 5'-phosphate synthase glutaminase subunit PdxT [Candidatus Thermoplasmatota archaeon]
MTPERLRLGVLALQGAFAEHRVALERALEVEGLPGEVVGVRRPDELAAVDGLAMPGGESTTISRLLLESGLHDAVRRRAAEERFPLLATCAGMILVAKEGDRQVADTDTRLLGLVDMAVDRNAFGRQRESFEADLDVKGLDAPFRGVFIRAPAVTRTWGAAEALATLGERTVAVREGNVLALAFHPELTDDVRLHREFVRNVAKWKHGRA